MSGMIQRDNLAGLIPEPVCREIFQGVVEQSSALKHGRRLPNMTSKTQAINVLDMLPMAYWVEGDTGFKETSSMAWERARMKRSGSIPRGISLALNSSIHSARAFVKYSIHPS